MPGRCASAAILVMADARLQAAEMKASKEKDQARLKRRVDTWAELIPRSVCPSVHSHCRFSTGIPCPFSSVRCPSSVPRLVVRL